MSIATEYILIEQSPSLQGAASLAGAKNAVLVIMASLLLAPGRSRLSNVPFSDDITHMTRLLHELGATVCVDTQANTLEIDTSNVTRYSVSADIMKKMRASILVMGPLLARFGKAAIAQPGGCVIGSRPIDFHLKAFSKMGASITCSGETLYAEAQGLLPVHSILEYPSVGATENILMAAVLAQGKTRIVNAALEPEVYDLIAVLKKMGATISLLSPSTIEVEGVKELRPVDHAIMYDRLEAGSLLLAAAITGGELVLPQAPASSMEVFLAKLQEMGHDVSWGADGVGVWFKGSLNPRAVSFKTMPYPGFPTDLQAPMMAALCLASGTSIICETVFENRLVHVRELQKMGAQITVDGHTATICGVDELYGAQVIASDIRASCALVLAGLAAQGHTSMTGVHHLRRGYEGLVQKLTSLGARISIKSE